MSIRRLTAALLLAPALAVGALALAGCGASGDPGASGDAPSSDASGGSSASDAPQEHVVGINGVKWTPAEIEIEVGDTVVWDMDGGGMAHDVVSDDDLFASELMKDGEFRHTFTEAGEFGYHCTPHPMMVGTVVVVEP